MHFVISTVIFFAFATAFLVVTQDIQVFPAALMSLHKKPIRNPKTLPPGVESDFIETPDGEKLEVWRLAPEPDTATRPFVGIIFHGNGATLENFLLIQLWFQELGITSYNFDYRGFGHSSGWPNEKKVYLDSDTFYEHVLEREQITPEQLIVVGVSVGGPFAARIAGKHNPALLILVSTFTDIPRLLTETPVLRYLRHFCWYKLPTIDYIKALRDSSLILLHGKHDKTIPFTHSQNLAAAYSGTGQSKLLLSERADHNTVFFLERRLLAEATLDVLTRR